MPGAQVQGMGLKDNFLFVLPDLWLHIWEAVHTCVQLASGAGKARQTSEQIESSLCLLSCSFCISALVSASRAAGLTISSSCDAALGAGGEGLVSTDGA